MLRKFPCIRLAHPPRYLCSLFSDLFIRLDGRTNPVRLLHHMNKCRKRSKWRSFASVCVLPLVRLKHMKGKLGLAWREFLADLQGSGDSSHTLSVSFIETLAWLPFSYAGSVVDYPQSEHDASNGDSFFLFFFLSLPHFASFFPPQNYVERHWIIRWILLSLGDFRWNGVASDVDACQNICVLSTRPNVGLIFLSLRASSLLVTLMCFPSRPRADGWV